MRLALSPRTLPYLFLRHSQAGMGGGTGRGAAPVVAGIARRQGTFTVGIALSATHQHLQVGRKQHQAAAAATTGVSCCAVLW